MTTRGWAIEEQARIWGQGASLGMICEGIHMAVTGSCEPMTDTEAEEARRFLAIRLATWVDSGNVGWNEYDRRVYKLVKTTLVDLVIDIEERKLREKL